jgi:small subunit ribosomal protein S16
MVRIRLKRTGRRHKPSYRVTAVDSRRSRDGITLEELGYYDPGNRKPELRYNLDMQRIQYWLDKGAQPSETVRDLIRKTQAGAAAK